MKYLRLVDHNGKVTLVQQVFVEGPDFEWVSPEPVAMWFGKIQLLDKLPVEERYTRMGVERGANLEEGQEVEFEKVSAAGSRDSRTASPDELESLEVSSEPRTGGDTSKGDKRDRGAKKS